MLHVLYIIYKHVDGRNIKKKKALLIITSVCLEKLQPIKYMYNMNVFYRKIKCFVNQTITTIFIDY